MKMQKTDIGVVAVMYAVCALFYYMNTQLKKESQTYPTFTIALLFGLTTLYLVQMLFKARKFGVESGADKEKALVQIPKLSGQPTVVYGGVEDD